MKKIECEICNRLITSNNFMKHKVSCENIKQRVENDYPAILNCKFCGKLCKNKNSFTNHQRLCPKNKNRVYKNGMSGKYNRCNQYSKAKKLGLPKPSISDETRNKLRVSNTGRKHSEETKNIEYNGSILESSYELMVAKILDELNIEWIKVRKGFIWDDNGKKRRYIPDFYLPKYDIYLDPKNSYLINKDKIKIESAVKLNNIIVYVLGIENINKEYICSILPH